jgi:hypothetical protein
MFKLKNKTNCQLYLAKTENISQAETKLAKQIVYIICTNQEFMSEKIIDFFTFKNKVLSILHRQIRN